MAGFVPFEGLTLRIDPPEVVEFGAGDDVVLYGASRVGEAGAVAGDPYRQVGVALGVGLGIPQGGGVHHIELHIEGAAGAGGLKLS